MKISITATILLALFCTAPAIAQSISAPDRTVRITLPNGSFGHGILLDRQRILTAAHLVDDDRGEHQYRIDTNTTSNLSSKLLKIGNRLSLDLAILKLEQDYPGTLSPLRICSKAPAPGDSLLVVFLSGERFNYLVNGASTHASYDKQSMYKGEIFSEMTEAYFSHGVSGSPVFQIEGSCLGGIISRYEISGDLNCIQQDLNGTLPPMATCHSRIGTRFVSSLDILPFVHPVPSP